LVLTGRDYGDFQLRFDMRVKLGAGAVQMRGPGRGPWGIAVEVGTSSIQWLMNGSFFCMASSVEPGDWNSYRIVARSEHFQLFRNEVSTAYEIIAGHGLSKGKLSILMPTGMTSEIELRNIRLKE
jgi:hypothetical protein